MGMALAREMAYRGYAPALTARLKDALESIRDENACQNSS